MSDNCTYTALYRDWTDRKKPWVLIQRTPSGFDHIKILRDLPSIGQAILYVMETYGVEPKHWSEIDTVNHRARAPQLRNGAA